MNIFQDRYELARTGLKGPVARYCCETFELSGIKRVETASYDQAGRLREGTHQLAGPVIRRTFGYDGGLLVEEQMYSDGRLKRRSSHLYDGGYPCVSRFYDEVSTLTEEHHYEFHYQEGVGTAALLDYGRVSNSAQAFRMAGCSFYLRLNQITAERRLVSIPGQILTRFFFDNRGLVRGCIFATYDENDQLILERCFAGSSVFSNIWTVPEGMNEVALVRHKYLAFKRCRIEILEQEGRITETITEADVYGNPVYRAQTSDAAYGPHATGSLITTYTYDYDKHTNWVKQVVTGPSQGGLPPCMVTSTRELEYY